MKALPLFLAPLWFAWAAALPAQARSHLIANVPFFPDKEYQCGPAVLAGSLNFWGVAADMETLKKEFYLDKLKGSLPMDLVQAARKREVEAHIADLTLDQLKEELLKNRPVIALLNFGNRFVSKGHFILITGFNDEKKGLFAHSGKEKNKFFPYKRFLKRWNRAGQTLILIRPKGEAIDHSNVRP